MKMLLPLTALCFVTACGGSGDSDNSAGPSTQTQANGPLKVTVHEALICGGSMPVNKAELFTYDDNWKITGRHKAAADGSFIITTNDKLINFSLVNNQGDKQQPKLNQKVFAQVQPGDFGTQYLGTSSQNCECTQATANIATVSSSSVSSLRVYAEYDARNFASLSGNTATFEICRQKGSSWPELVMSAQTRNGDTFYGVLDNYQPTQSMLINLDKVALPVAFTSNVNSPGFISYHGSKHAYVRAVSKGVGTPVLISGLKDLNFVSYYASSTGSIPMPGEVNATYYVTQMQNRSSDFQRPVAFVLPDLNRAENFTRQVLTDWSNLENSVNYDYSDYAGFTAVNVILNIELKDQSYISQQFIGPLKGRFPADLLPTDYLSDSVVNNASGLLFDVVLEQATASSTLTAHAKQRNRYYSALSSKIERQGDMTSMGMYFFKSI